MAELEHVHACHYSDDALVSPHMFDRARQRKKSAARAIVSVQLERVQSMS